VGMGTDLQGRVGDGDEVHRKSMNHEIHAKL